MIHTRERAGVTTSGGNHMQRRTVLKGITATAATGFVVRRAAAATPLKIGVSMPLTGAGFNAVGRQLQAALKLYV
jgi:hypothetical protein